MPAKDFLVDPSRYDVNKVLYDLEQIRACNRQRYEFEQLSAVVFASTEDFTCVGYKDFAPDEFWIRGHMPGFPLLPGVMMCEAAAQLASFFATKYDLLGPGIVGLGGLEEVRFRGMVRPGDRLIVSVKQVKCRRGRMITCQFQGLVGEGIVCDGIIKGVPLQLESIPGVPLPAAPAG